MAKRFTATEIWSEDWFLDMPNGYKLFWYYMLSNCDHAGIYKVNLRSFRGLIEDNLTSKTALTYFNAGKQRIREISENLWLIEDFFVYQYGQTFNINNRLHESILLIYKKYNIELTSIRGLKDLKEGVKDKDKEIKKGGTGENKIKPLGAVEFDEDKNGVFFPDGSYQELGELQKEAVHLGRLIPNAVIKGAKY